ncbi:hypothetical protein SDC9_162411 [bioreactor metagenome]|uniref:Uncharacterized protein n=1 Tax=bioreactor metagenome TaxID=1076179 RepID=A0A645FNC9_9ZZZZ
MPLGSNARQRGGAVPMTFTIRLSDQREDARKAQTARSLLTHVRGVAQYAGNFATRHGSHHLRADDERNLRTAGLDGVDRRKHCGST